MAVRAGENEVVAVLLVHGLGNQVGRLVQHLGKLLPGVSGGVVQPGQRYALQRLHIRAVLAVLGVQHLVNGLEAGVGGIVLFQHVVADIVLAVHHQPGLAQPERLGGGGGVLGVGIENTLAQHRVPGAVHADEGIHQIAAVAFHHTAGCCANHSLNNLLIVTRLCPYC